MSKRSLFVRLVPCRCLRGEEEIVTSLDYSHCSLETVPKEIFNFEKTLQELYLDANQIEELPKVRHALWCIETFSVCTSLLLGVFEGYSWALLKVGTFVHFSWDCIGEPHVKPHGVYNFFFPPPHSTSNCLTASYSTDWACQITTWQCCQQRSQTSSISGSLMSAKTVSRMIPF